MVNDESSQAKRLSLYGVLGQHERDVTKRINDLSSKVGTAVKQAESQCSTFMTKVPPTANAKHIKLFFDNGIKLADSKLGELMAQFSAAKTQKSEATENEMPNKMM